MDDRTLVNRDWRGKQSLPQLVGLIRIWLIGTSLAALDWCVARCARSNQRTRDLEKNHDGYQFDHLLRYSLLLTVPLAHTVRSGPS